MRGVVIFIILGFSFAASAQTVHEVQVGVGFSFVPDELTIQTGDTVSWVWVGAGHNVVSGDIFGNPDGIFYSGPPANPPNTFEVVFDAEFIFDNPVPSHEYVYFCDPHVGFGMIGRVIIADASPLFVRGDCNADGDYGLPDPIFGLQVLFTPAGPAPCVAACDFNNDDSFALVDMIGVLGNLFSGGPPPAAPFPECGQDPTPDLLTCLDFPPCS